MYTSGCPKNQNRCSYSSTFPPPVLSKKLVLILRSSNNIVIAPANTGSATTNREVVIPMHQQNIDIWFKACPGVRHSRMVTRKFILPRIDLTPALWRERITKSTLLLLCPRAEDKGGYNVHLVPAPPPINILVIINVMATGNNQKLKLFRRGNAISGQHKNKGNNQLPKPPMRAGITMKKIMINA